MILEFDRPSLVTTTLNNPPELGRRLTATSSNSSTGQSVFRVTLTKQAGSDLCRAYLHARHQLNQWRTPVEISSQFMEKQAYVVKREFKARLMQEVTLKTGDSCNILTRYGDTGWAQGQNHNSKRKGVFPLCVFTDRPTTRSSAFFLPNIQSSTPVMRPGIYRFFRTEKAPSQPQSKSSKSKAPPQHPLHLIIRAEEEPVRIIKHQLENHLYVFGRSLRSNEEGWISVVGGNMKGLLQVVEPVPGTVVRPEAGFSRSPGARPVLLRVGDWIDVEMVRGFDKVIGRVRRAAVVQAAITGQPIGSPAEGNEEVWVQIPLDVLEPIVLRDEDLL
ncbi:hypothetical protein BJ742DRAFT_172779 [Cladochytrium replicatum]|nr:hypothetical protein BJ742DRAFT_172779 [Cladochytrium replicatum]